MLLWPKSSGCCCSGCGTIKVTVGSCVFDVFAGQTTGTPTVGATVTVYDSLGNVVGSPCTTPSTGICEIPIDAAGTYDVKVTKSGLPTTIVTVNATCTTNNVTVPLGRAFRFTVTLCGTARSGSTITLTHTATGTVTKGVVPPGNPATVDVGVIATGAHTWTVSAVARTGSASGSASYSAFFACLQTIATVDLSPATGYHCAAIACSGTIYSPSLSECNYPLPETLHLTDSVYGSVTMQYYGPGAYPSTANCFATTDSGIWYATRSITRGPCSGFAIDETMVIQYVLQQTTTTSGGGTVPAFSVVRRGEPGDVGCGPRFDPPCNSGGTYCPPDLELTWTGDSSLPASGRSTNQRRYYCDAVPTFTLTE